MRILNGKQELESVIIDGRLFYFNGSLLDKYAKAMGEPLGSDNLTASLRSAILHISGEKSIEAVCKNTELDELIRDVETHLSLWLLQQ